MRPVEQFVFIVDGYRRPSRQRNAAGRYRVSEKTSKKAEKLLQKTIKFGSIQYLGTVDECDTNNTAQIRIPYQSVAKYTGPELRHLTIL